MNSLIRTSLGSQGACPMISVGSRSTTAISRPPGLTPWTGPCTTPFISEKDIESGPSEYRSPEHAPLGLRQPCCRFSPGSPAAAEVPLATDTPSPSPRREPSSESPSLSQHPTSSRLDSQKRQQAAAVHGHPRRPAAQPPVECPSLPLTEPPSPAPA